MNKVLLTIVFFVVSFCEAFGMRASIAPNSRKVFYVGEWAYVAVQIDDLQDYGGHGNKGYVLEHVSGNAPWLIYTHRQDYASGEELNTDQPQYHWQNNQLFWIEMSGKATQPGFYNGRLSVSHMNGVGHVDVAYLDYSFEVRDHKHDLAVISRDYAASYNRQIELHSYIVNLSGSSITLYNPYIDYYMTKAEGMQVVLNAWGRPRNSCVQVLDCGKNHLVVRRHMLGAVELNAASVNFQLGINEIPSQGNRTNYSPLSEKDVHAYDESSVDDSYNGYSIDYSTRAMHRNWFYNDHMALVANDGIRYYGNAPKWFSEESCHAATLTTSLEYQETMIRTQDVSAFCQDGPAPLSSSSSSTENSSSSQNLVARFADATQNNENGIRMYFDVENKGDKRVSLDGYEIWFYFNDAVASALAQSMFDINYPADGSISQEIKKCAEKKYVLKLHFGSGTSVNAHKTFPNGGVQGILHDESWQYVFNKSDFASWENYSTLTENPKMVLFDEQGRQVYGEIQWPCGETIQSSSSSFSSNDNLFIRFSDISNILENSNESVFDMQFDIVNMSNKSGSLDGYEMLFYYNDAGDLFKPVFESVELGGAKVRRGFPRTERCAADKYVVRYKFANGANLAPYGLYPNGGGKIKAKLSNSTYFDKTKFASWPPVYNGSMVENPNMALFDQSGNLVYGTPAWPCDGYSEKSLILAVEGKRNYRVYVLPRNKEVDNAIGAVSLKIENYGDSVVPGPVYVDFHVTQAAGYVPMLVMGENTLSVAGANMVVNDQDGGPISITRISAGDKHTFRFTLLNGIGAANANKPYSREISFELMNQCIFECRDTEEEVALFRWNLSDDWSADGLGSSYVVTDRVPIYNSGNKLLYGVPDPSIPVYAVSNNADLVLPKTNVDPQEPNRTDAVLYSGGQLLSGGDFETPWVQGWNIYGDNGSTPFVKSVRAQSPQGSRHLFLYNRTSVSQSLREAAIQVLKDSGAVLTVWHKGGEALVKVNGRCVDTLRASRNSWIVDEIPIESSYFNDNGFSEFSITTETDTILVDDAILVPGRTAQPVTYVTRFTNTIGEELETRAYDGAEEQLITTSERDHLGRLWKKYLPFALPCKGAEACNSNIKTQNNPAMAKLFYTKNRTDYPDAGDVPYVETAWKPDQQATVDAVGAPGVAFGLDSTHLSRTFSSGVNMDGVDLLDSSSLNSAVSACLDMRRYGGSRHAEKDTNYHAAKDSDPTHLWELVIDRDERRAFTVKDGEGHVIVSGSLDKDGKLLTRSVNEFDARGNVITAHPPMSCKYTNAPTNCVDPSTFEYDAQSRVIKSGEPDAGESRSFYDIAGRLRATQTQRQIDSGWVSVVGYDHFDRVIYTGKWETSLDEAALREYFNNVDNLNSPSVDELTPGTVTRTFYDRTPRRDTLGVVLYPLGIGADPTYTLGRVAAVISDVRAVFDDDGSAVVATDGSDSVLRVSYAYSYDKYGCVLANYAYDPTMPADSLKMLWTTTKYDLGGKVVSTAKNSFGLSFASIVFRAVTERYTYDRLGRVDSIYSMGIPLAHYEYYPTGSVKSVDLGNSLTLTYTYHISGAVKTAEVKDASGANLYSETLYYEDCGSDDCKPQYNGNISRMVHQLAHGNSEYGERRDVAYTYDMLNRLVGVDDSEQDLFDEIFEYDAQGRIAAQRRAEKKKKGYQIPASGGEYTYENKTNRLMSVAKGVGSTMNLRYSRALSASEWFQYDKEGNLIEDRSKSMSIKYDWRGMPVEFRRQNSCGKIAGAIRCDSTKLVLAYDGSGRRISKTHMHRGVMAAGWDTETRTHYTGIGTEVRENFAGPAKETKVVVNMPQGLGRYGIESAGNPGTGARSFEWYLKNHLGSTMLVYGTGGGSSGGLQAAYDYRSFGEQITMTSPSTGKVTENFTGKERDDETQLNYFGARYLDPMLGMWISVDPARQFASPYLYAGNGMNPMNIVDPDGNAPYQIAIFVDNPDMLKAKPNEGLGDDFHDFKATAKWGQEKFGKDFEIRIIRNQKEMHNFVKAGQYTAIIGHGIYDEEGNPIQGKLVKSSDDTKGIDLYLLDFELLETESKAKVFACGVGRWDDLFDNIDLGSNKGPLHMGDAYQDAADYLMENKPDNNK